MAGEYKTVLVFEDENGKTINFTYKHVQADPNKSVIVAAMDAFIANGSIFKRVPVKKKTAYVVLTNKTDIDISE